MHDIERQIIEALVASVVGSELSVTIQSNDDYECYYLRDSNNPADIMRVITNSAPDDVNLRFHTSSGRPAGWVKLMFGNLNDVISDYSVNAGLVIGPALELAEKFS